MRARGTRDRRECVSRELSGVDAVPVSHDQRKDVVPHQAMWAMTAPTIYIQTILRPNCRAPQYQDNMPALVNFDDRATAPTSSLKVLRDGYLQLGHRASRFSSVEEQ